MYKPEQTAMQRIGPSAPLKYFLQHNLVTGSILDYGCGKGADVRHLLAQGYQAVGWDPNFPSTKPAGKYDTVLCTFVLNVLLPEERQKVIAHVKNLTKGKAIFTVRSWLDGIKGTPIHDGFLTRKGTFQKPFDVLDLQKELGEAAIIHKGRFIIGIV